MGVKLHIYYCGVTFTLLLFIISSLDKNANGIKSSFCYEKSDNYNNRGTTKKIDVSSGSSIKLECHFCFCYEKSDNYNNRGTTKIIDVSSGSSIKLECHFCNEQDDFQAKVWYYRKRGNKSAKYELVNFNYETIENDIDISPSHTLHLKHFDGKYDSGIYFCSYFNAKEKIFTYVLDGVYSVKLTPKVGTKKEWYDFRRNVIDPTNYLIQKINGSLLFPFEIIFSWSKWGFCNTYGHENVRQRSGKCRIRPIRHKILQWTSSTQSVDEKLAAYLLDSYTVSCRSIELGTFYPEISRVTRKLPEFIIKETCNKTLKRTKKKYSTDNYFKYNVTKHVAENGYLILTCPDYFATSDISWYKDNCLINSSYRNNMAQSLNEPHLTIDAYSALYILRATKSDEGVYACTVDGRNIQTFNVKVVTKYTLLNQDFIRYSIYLGFVLSLTVTCYCAGICVAWQRRASFADPLHLMKKNYSYVSCDHEPFLN